MSFAFLLALEALNASQRAVLLLRDVFDYSVRETADALGVSEASVKTTLHRARNAMTTYRASAVRPTAERQARTRKALQALCMHLMTHNVAALEALLAADVRARNDSGGEFFSARKPVLGRDKVILFHLKTGKVGGSKNLRAQIRMINGMPALVAQRAPSKLGVPPRMVVWIELDAAGRISAIDSQVATNKLRAIDFDHLPAGTSLLLAEAARAAASVPPPRTWAPRAAKQLAVAGIWRSCEASRGGSVHALRSDARRATVSPHRPRRNHDRAHAVPALRQEALESRARPRLGTAQRAAETRGRARRAGA